MKKIIQISILLLAILVGLAWEIFRSEIHDFLRLPDPYVAQQEASPAKTGVIAITPTAKPPGAKAPQETGIPGDSTLRKKEASNSPQKPVVVDKMPAQEKEATTAANDAGKKVVPAVAPKPTGEMAKEDQETQLQRIVRERYPDIPNIPFPDKYPDLGKLPKTAFPARIQTRQELHFKFTQEGKVVGISLVKADGFVSPLQIENDEIRVSSLTNDEMSETLPLSETNFATVVEANYHEGLQRAIERVEKMREADRVDLRKNPTLYEKLIAEGKVWHKADDEKFEKIKMSAELLLADRSFKPVEFYENGHVMIDEEGPYSGGYFAVIVLIQGTDKGFGPYHWRAKCLLRDERIVGWLGLPDNSPDDNS